jgi:hypothetical protein
MNYSDFKALQALLFFGVVFGFGVYQLVAVKREIRRDAERKRAQEARRASEPG